MKKYDKPILDIVKFDNLDVIMQSPASDDPEDNLDVLRDETEVLNSVGTIPAGTSASVENDPIDNAGLEQSEDTDSSDVSEDAVAEETVPDDAVAVEEPVSDDDMLETEAVADDGVEE